MQSIDYLPDDPNDPGNGGGTSNPPPATSYGTQVMSVGFTKKDAASTLDVTVYLNCNSADDLRYSAYLFLDDQLVQVGTSNFIFDEPNSSAQGTMTFPAMIEGASAGNHSISVRIKNRENEAALQLLPGSMIKVAELRQSAR